jgi:adenine-specific DNA-methyltransferase
MGTSKTQTEKTITYHNIEENKEISISYQEVFQKNFNYMLKFTRKPNFGILENYQRKLKDIAEIRQGVVAGPDRLRITNRNKLDNISIRQNQGIFVLSNEEVVQKGFTERETNYLLPFSYVRNLAKDTYDSLKNFHHTHQIIYLNKTNIDRSEVPNILNHLQRFKPIMNSRRETQMGKRLWYELHWPRTKDIFEKPRIISIRRTMNPRFILAEIPFVTDLSTNIIVPIQTVDIIDLYNYLISSKVTSWINYYAKRKGKILQVDKSVLEKIPVPNKL